DQDVEHLCLPAYTMGMEAEQMSVARRRAIDPRCLVLPAAVMDTKNKPYCYDYPRPAVTVDVVIVTRDKPRRVLLIRRKHEPFAGLWALPGGFVDMDEGLEAAARRELQEETGVRAARLEQLGAFGEP